MYDISFATELSVLECGKDFIQRYKTKDTVKKSVPVLASACPGQYGCAIQHNYKIDCYRQGILHRLDLLRRKNSRRMDPALH